MLTSMRMGVLSPFSMADLVDGGGGDGVDVDGAGLEGDARAALGHVQGVGDLDDAGFDRQAGLLGAVGDDGVQRLGQDDGARRLFVQALQQSRAAWGWPGYRL